MKSHLRAACLFALVSVSAPALAQNPFVGTWTVDPAKSHLSGETLKFGPAQGGALEVVTGASRYSFRIDGGNYRMDSGDLAAWKETAPNTWTTTYSNPQGKLLSTETWQLSADGNTLSTTSTGTRPDGQTYTDAVIYVRTGPAVATAPPATNPPGSAAPADNTAAATDTPPFPLSGTWKSTDVKMGLPESMTIRSAGLDGVILELPAMKASCQAYFDGKDYRAVGPTVPPTLTLALQRTAPDSFKLTERFSGKDVFVSKYTVAADGKTMTEIGSAPGDPPQTVIWEKQ